MNDQLPPQPASEPGDRPAPLEYLAGPDEAGDSACWAQFVCPECGALLSEDTCHGDARYTDACHTDRDLALRRIGGT